MIKKVKNENMDMVPRDIQELLVPETGEYVPVGSNVYEVFSFSIDMHFNLLSYMGKYYELYNEVFNSKETIGTNEFIGLLCESLNKNNLIKDFMKTFFSDMGDDGNNITFEQFKFLLGVIYKLNFSVKKNPPQIQAAMNQMMSILGLNQLSR